MYSRIKKIIAERLSLSEDEIRMDSSFLDDLGADSLDIVELIMAFEEEFDLKIPDEEAEKIETVKDVVDYIQSHLGNDLENTEEISDLDK
ncbi:MAG TPA: acyl carrier protein [Candidatus Atribacteria bacterium]|nr:acyl carrier protein [Candidatus Atribacteria bacterium]